MNALTTTLPAAVAASPSPPRPSLFDRLFRRERAPLPGTTNVYPIYPADSLLNFVAMAITDPATDVAKLETLLRMQREIVADEAKLQFNAAMARVQAEMQPILRNAENDHTKSKYAPLDAIDAIMRPIYSRHGFCLSFNSEPIDGASIRVVCEVARGAHSKTYSLEAALDVAGSQGKANKTPIQGLGSSVSYLRRYLTCMIFHVVMTNEDNDGNGITRRGGAILLTAAQVEELNALMRETFTLEAKFLSVMCPGLQAIEKAPGADFPRLRNALRAKRDTLAKRAAPKTGVAA